MHKVFSVHIADSAVCCHAWRKAHLWWLQLFLPSWGWWVAELPGQSISKCFSPTFVSSTQISLPPFSSCKNGLAVWFRIILMFVQWPRFEMNTRTEASLLWCYFYCMVFSFKKKLQSPELYCKSQHKSGKEDCSELSSFLAECSAEDLSIFSLVLKTPAILV